VSQEGSDLILVGFDADFLCICSGLSMILEGGHLGAAVWARPLRCSPFGRRCLGAAVSALCRVIAVNVQ